MDDNQYHITEDFINRSWENMRMKLDQEIPIRRRKPWWLFLVALTMLIASAGYFAWKSTETGIMDSEKTIPVEQNLNSAVESSDFVSETYWDAVNDENDLVNSSNVNEENTVTEDKSDVTYIKSSISENTEDSKKQNLNVNPIVTKSQLVFEKQSEYINEEIIDGNELGLSLILKNSDSFPIQSEIENSNERLGLQELTDLNRRPLVSFTMMPLSSPNLMAYNYVDFLAVPRMTLQTNIEVLQKDIPQPTFGLGVYTSALSNEFRAISGFDAGISSYWSIGHSWRVTVGFGYQQFNFKTSEEELLDAAAGVELDMDTTAFSSVVMLDYSSANNLINKTSHLHGQLGIAYEMFSSLWLTGGLRISKLLNATNEELYINSSALEQNQVNIGSTYLLDNDHTDNWGLGLMTGFEWQMHRNISLLAQYHFGLDPILRENSLDSNRSVNENETTHFQRFARVGLHIYFK